MVYDGRRRRHGDLLICEGITRFSSCRETDDSKTRADVNVIACGATALLRPSGPGTRVEISARPTLNPTADCATRAVLFVTYARLAIDRRRGHGGTYAGVEGQPLLLRKTRRAKTVRARIKRGHSRTRRSDTEERATQPSDPDPVESSVRRTAQLYFDL